MSSRLEGGAEEPATGVLAAPAPDHAVAADLPAADREELLRHGARSLARRAVRDTIPYVVLTAALALTSPALQDRAVLFWVTLLACSGIGAVRFHLSRSFERIYDRDPARWRRGFALTTLGLAGLWGALCCAVAALYELQYPSVLVMCATAVASAGAVSSLGLDRRLLTGFLLLVLAPLAIAALLVRGPEGITLSMVVALYFMVLVKEGRYQHRHYWSSIANLLRLHARSAELDRARVRVEAESQAKSDFLARMSHEVRNPLNGVLGMATLVLDTPLTEVQREYANTIRRSAESMLDVLNDVLDLSKIEAGRMTIEPIDFDLQELVEDIGALVAPAAHAKGVELVVRIPPGFPRRLRGDAKRVREVITNLAGNATKFTEHGEVAIELDLLSEGEESASFRLTVRDTGIGIAADRQQAVFQGFTQAEESTSRLYGGTGLGLSIAKRLVTLMGGTLALDSEPGRGTTFRIDLTLEKQRDAKPAPARDPDRPRARLLAVDDSVSSRTALADQLRSLGGDVECVASGRAALDALEQRPERSRFDLVVIDSAMPGMSGLELARAMRADRRFAKTPIVLLQPTGEAGTADEARRLGIAAVVTKPPRAHLLHAAVAAGLGATVDAPAPAPRAEAANLSGLGLRVLVADDQAVNRAVAVRLCERMGVAADAVSNGHEVVAALMRDRYSAVLMDADMPEMDGFAAAREIRRLERLHGGHIPIIALTGHVRPSDLARCREAGMDDTLTKPIRPEDLSRAVLKWCGKPAPSTRSASSLQSVAAAPAEEPAPSRSAVLNVEQLELVSGNDANFERLLRDQFLTSLPPLLDEADSALVAGDLERVHAIAHRLKGSIRTMGGDAAGDACEALEEAAEQPDREAVSRGLRAVRHEVARLDEAMRLRDRAA